MIHASAKDAEAAAVKAVAARAEAARKALATKGYAFGNMSATDAWEVLKILGPGIIGAIMGAKAGRISTGDLGAMAGALTALNRGDYDIVRDLLLKSCTVKGKEITNFDAFFTGKMFELLQVLSEALRVNFADFLAAAQAPSSESATTE